VLPARRLTADAAAVASAAAWIAARLIYNPNDASSYIETASRELELAAGVLATLRCRTGTCEPHLRRVK
jgi:hypothetical protein